MPKLTKKQRKLVREAYKALSWFDEQMACLCDDPMTEAMGAPVGDFAEAWSRTHRQSLSEHLQQLHEANIGQVLQNYIVAELTSHI